MCLFLPFSLVWIRHETCFPYGRICQMTTRSWQLLKTCRNAAVLRPTKDCCGMFWFVPDCERGKETTTVVCSAFEAVALDSICVNSSKLFPWPRPCARSIVSCAKRHLHCPRRCRGRRVQLRPFRRDLTLDGYPVHGNGRNPGKRPKQFELNRTSVRVRGRPSVSVCPSAHHWIIQMVVFRFLLMVWLPNWPQKTQSLWCVVPNHPKPVGPLFGMFIYAILVRLVMNHPQINVKTDRPYVRYLTSTRSFRPKVGTKCIAPKGFRRAWHSRMELIGTLVAWPWTVSKSNPLCYWRLDLI